MQNQYLLSETVVETTPSAVPLALATPDEKLTKEVVQPLPTSQAATSLLACLQRKIRQRKFCFQFTNAVIVGYGLTNLLYLVPGMREWIGEHMFLQWMALLIFLALVIVFIHALLIPIKMDVHELLRAGGKRAIPVLFDAFIALPTKANSQLCLGPLTLLLPQLQATDAALLTSRHRRFLNSV